MKFPNLFSPLKIGGVTLKNRIISAPMTYPILTSDGCLTPEAAAFYELRAKGGAAVVTVSELIVDSKTGKYYPVQVITDAPNAKDSLAMAARAVRRHGAVASMELSHGGQFAITQGPTLGPIDVYQDGALITRAMTKAMVAGIIESYAKSAALCRDAGFEMLLIHAGHGWLLEQFLSPATNSRTDEYGGDLPGRARLALEVISAVREVVGPKFPLELRISAEEYIDGGYSFDDVIAFAKLVEPLIDLLQVSTGAHHGSFDKTHPSMFAPRGVNVHYAADIRKHVDIPVAAIGALNEPDMLEDIIASGQADTVVMARALLADPYLPRKAMEGRDDEIIRCCRCFTCMAERLKTGLRVCALNPVIGSEYEHNFVFSRPSAEPRRVLIAGGGPGGMQCAVTAKSRGHEVILCEKQSELGGALNAIKGVGFKSDLYKFVSVMTRQMEKAGVDIRLNTEVTPELVREIAPDTLIIAAGAESVVPAIPGVENAVPVESLPDLQIGQNVAIIGGGLSGCETAIHLAKSGHAVTVVEMADQLCADANPRHRPLLLAELESCSVTCLTSAQAVRIAEDGLVCRTQGGETALLADTIILATGRGASVKTAEALRGTAPYVEMIGDCVKPANVAEAVFRGHFAAIDL
ncbi:MAG: FAD-dependent oxidoreductase [Oscillospiraceae bacterium]|nr:FAD-dependent oxidoreductase [Oscillospiraceae bacterium]